MSSQQEQLFGTDNTIVVEGVVLPLHYSLQIVYHVSKRWSKNDLLSSPAMHFVPETLFQRAWNARQSLNPGTTRTTASLLSKLVPTTVCSLFEGTDDIGHTC